MHENVYALFRAMVGALGGTLDEQATLARHLAPPTNPMFKGVWHTRLDAGNADATIEETITWFKARNAPFFFWWVDPTTTPSDLSARLIAHGLLSMEEQQKELAPGIISTEEGAPGMVADLQKMNEAALKTVPPGFVIEQVRDEKSLQDFKRVIIEGYEMPEFAVDGWVQAARQAGIGKAPWQMYLGRLNGQPVATNMLFNGGGVASVYGVATIPSMRGKGIGSAITLQPLLAARDLGYRYAVLFATEMGIHTYERIGFRLTGKRLNRYLWRRQ